MIQLKPPQWAVFRSSARFRVLVAGRRFGKTYLSLVELCRAAWKQGRLAWYVAPTYKQAKRVAWKPLKQMTRPYWASPPNETDLRIELISGGTICLRGADNYDSLRGDGLDFVILDEYASMAKEAWPEVLRPALADREGHALFIGTPHGFNHFYELYQTAQNQSHWEAFQFTTEEGGNVSTEELAQAGREMDERLFRQEFRASFEHLHTGRAYWAFDRTLDVKPVEFDPRFELCWSLDFNIDPACSVLCQIVHDQVNVLDEISLRNSNTPAVCEEFERRSKPWWRIGQRAGLIDVRVFGDATGDSRKSSASRTDWQIVKEFFKSDKHMYNLHMNVPASNPPLKDRINCVNAVIQNAPGVRRLNVAPRCVQLIRDLEQVCWKTDSSGNMVGELDHSDPARTHMSDALGYLIASKFPMRPQVGEMPYHWIGGTTR